MQDEKSWDFNKRYQWVKIEKVMLEKLQETLKSDSQSLMLKAAEDSTKSHASAIEVKSVMDECKQKVVEMRNWQAL